MIRVGKIVFPEPPQFLLALVVAFHLCLISSLSADTVLIDFGNDDSFRGVSVTNPASNGTHWNSVWSGAFYSDLVDVNGTTTDIDFGFSSAGGTDYFNGPSGSTQNPSASVYVASALGNLGVDEAVYDYYVDSTFQIQQLDPNKRYNLTFFGSHKFNNDNITRFTVYTDATFSTAVASVDLLVGVNGDHNQDALAVLTNIAPQDSDILYIGFEGSTGGNGYLNAMQIEAVAIPEPGVFVLVSFGSIAMIRRRR